jgi:hypothetical protein
MFMKKGIGLIFLILFLASVVSLAQSPGTPPGIDPASAEKARSQGKALMEPTRRVADEKMTCVQIHQELSKIMIGMGPEADALGRASTRAEAVIEQAQREGGVSPHGQATQQRMQKTQPAMTELHSSAAAMATANAASGGMARVGVLMRLSKEKNCAHDTPGIPKEIRDESGDK